MGPVADHFPSSQTGKERKGIAGRARQRRRAHSKYRQCHGAGASLPKYWTCPSISTVAIDHIDRYSEQEKKKKIATSMMNEMKDNNIRDTRCRVQHTAVQ